LNGRPELLAPKHEQTDAIGRASMSSRGDRWRATTCPVTLPVTGVPMAHQQPRGFTRIQLLVVLVVITVLILLLVPTMSQRAHRFRQLAQFHARRAAMFQKSVGSKERAARDCEVYGGQRMIQIAREYRNEVNLCEKLAVYHSSLIPKYELAAAHPWLSVEADPPEPAP
jgi:Tfp pilus assembly protein PilE